VVWQQHYLTGIVWAVKRDSERSAFAIGFFPVKFFLQSLRRTLMIVDIFVRITLPC
jgi:hypothetical protein